MQQCQSMMYTIQWDFSLGRLDTAVMTLASFIADPRQGHRYRYKIVVSYLAKFKWDTIRIRTE